MVSSSARSSIPSMRYWTLLIDGFLDSFLSVKRETGIFRVVALSLRLLISLCAHISLCPSQRESGGRCPDLESLPSSLSPPPSLSLSIYLDAETSERAQGQSCCPSLVRESRSENQFAACLHSVLEVSGISSIAFGS